MNATIKTTHRADIVGDHYLLEYSPPITLVKSCECDGRSEWKAHGDYSDLTGSTQVIKQEFFPLPRCLVCGQHWHVEMASSQD